MICAVLRRALANSPGNERYQTLLANTEKAPELYRQIMAEMQKQEAAALRQQRGGAKSSADGRTAENAKSSSYADKIAWVVLVGVGVSLYLVYRSRRN